MTKIRSGALVFLKGDTDKPVMRVLGRQLDLFKLNSSTLLCTWRAPNGRRVYQHYEPGRLLPVTGLGEDAK